MNLDKITIAKYPFLKEATDILQNLNLTIKDLELPEYRPIVERAAERVAQAINKLQISTEKNAELEILSYPAAILIVAATKNSFIKRRYALVEGYRASDHLKNEETRVLNRVVSEFWRDNEAKLTSQHFSLRYTVFLRNSVIMKEDKWKLVNRRLGGGFIEVTKEEMCRLLSEEIRRHVEKKITLAEGTTTFPPTIMSYAKELVELAEKRLPKTQMPTVALQEAFPPCIRRLYANALIGKHLSHIERFTLTSFLASTNMPTDQIVSIFSTASDFNEGLTRYQVEHIAGKTGSKTKYNPPNCRKLKTHSVCVNPDSLCRYTNSPVAYYLKCVRLKGKSVTQNPQN